MGLQNYNGTYPYAQQGLESQPKLENGLSYSPRVVYQGGVDMEVTSSYGSNRSLGFSDQTSSAAATPNTNMSTFDSPPYEYESKYEPKYESHNYNTYPHNEFPNNFEYSYTSSTSFEPRAHIHQYPERHTPSTLGWLPNTDLLKLYDLHIEKGKEPFLQLLSRWTPTPETPEKVYLDSPSHPEKDSYPCQFPDHCGKKFTRPADLDRHYRHVHGSMEQRACFLCDRSNCSRGKEGNQFTRKDHYRDHLRDYHKEDIGSAKGSKHKDPKEFAKAQKTWVKERQINTNWWRCSKCLERVWVKHGLLVEWECQSCKLPCEEERKNRRLQKLEPSMCLDCEGSGWVFVRDEYIPCFCQSQMQAPDAPYDLDGNYNTTSYATSYTTY